MPIISAIPTGSLAPDSPSRIVPVRPPTSRLPSTENMTAGSVGASAAPRMPANVHEKPKNKCAASAISPAVANVPSTPREAISTAEARKRRQPTCIPPSKRMAIRATTPIRSTWRIEVWSASAGKRSDASAAARRKIAGPGSGKRSVNLLEASASEKPAATRRTILPNSKSSLTGGLAAARRPRRRICSVEFRADALERPA